MIKVLRSLVVGPLQDYAPAVAEELARVGYTTSSAGQHMAFVAHLSRWMEGEHHSVEDLTDDVLEKYFTTRRTAGYVNYRTMKAARPLRRVLATHGVVVTSTAVPTASQLVLDRFAEYLTHVRGLAAGTVTGYIGRIHPLVVARLETAGVGFDGLTSIDVHRFLAERCAGEAASSAQLCVSAVRSFLGFLHLDGIAMSVSAAAVPSAAGWSQAALPKDLTAAALAALLASCDRDTGGGRRDYAVMLLLCRIGLRAGEVAALELRDLHWGAGEFVVHGKGNHPARLPLPTEVGEALVEYLRYARPTGIHHTAVFLGHKAPHDPISSSGLSSAVARAARRAGLGTIHAHRLRHAAATQMLRGGSSFAEVGLVLRHQRQLTTAIYAKVDREALRGLTRAWPGAL
ncbi:tyrosine-type recombinase/integrase [Arthrobacter sp. 1P04PC]|uniref:tyrosine-type recombinase/integrase n=1 Tax=unclassified Arthrobacter TaxID=235627 RepID=UPI0039A0DEBF